MDKRQELFQKLYFMLFSASADAIELLENGRIQEAQERLIQVETDAEKLYISSDTTDEQNQLF